MAILLNREKAKGSALTQQEADHSPVYLPFGCLFAFLLLVGALRAELLDEPSTDLEVSVEYGPTRDYRSVDRVLLQGLSRLHQEKEVIGFSGIDAVVFMASPVATSWTCSAEIVSLLALPHANFSVRVLDTSHSSKEPNQHLRATEPGQGKGSGS